MEIETQEQIESYVNLYGEIRKRVQDSAVCAAIIQQVGKDARMKQMHAWRLNGNLNGVNNGDEPATEKQIAYLKRMGIEPPHGLTKQSASALIDESKQAA
jgi:hypothetical protein